MSEPLTFAVVEAAVNGAVKLVFPLTKVALLRKLNQLAGDGAVRGPSASTARPSCP